MKKSICFLLLLSFSVSILGQKELTLEAIWSGEFSPKRLAEIHSMNNPDEYSVFAFQQSPLETRIEVRSFSEKDKVTTLLSSDAIPIRYFEDYSFSSDEQLILLGAQIKKRYRYTASGLYFVYNRQTKTTVPVSDQSIINPKFSPDGTKVGYVFENNLYYMDIASAEIVQVTKDGKNNHIINGLADWVYEEEFELVTAFKWSPDSKKIAYLKFDESQVKEFDMPMYNDGNYPDMYTFKYPKAGEDNSKVSTYVYAVDSKKTMAVDLSKYENYYVPNIQWTSNENELAIKCMNRYQNYLQIIKFSTVNASTEVIYEEKNSSYIEYDNHLTFLKDNKFVLTNEKSGFNHLYLHKPNGEEIIQVTTGDYTVTDVYGLSLNEKEIYFQSTEGNTMERQLFQVGLNGKNKQQLTTKKGQHEIHFNADFSLFLDTYNNADTVPITRVTSSETKKELFVIEDNNDLQQKVTTYKLAKKEFSVASINGFELNTWMIKPLDFDASKKYPVLLYQYSGPNSQQVKNAWHSSNDFWFQMLAQKGYIVACLDGRGTGFKGQKFKTVTQNQLGKLETEDQIAFAESLAKLPYVDKARIGIWGWSYGGTTALNAILKGNHIFKTAISVAPVTNWRYYDTIYTERFMTTPQENPKGYDYNSPIFHAEKLKGNLLLVHGSADDNVHVQNSMQMISALTLAGKQFDLAIYTDKNHGIYGGNTRLHLYTKMTNYIIKNL